MATLTAQIMIGQKHSYDSGIINISHSLYLSENDRPAWILTSTDVFHERQAHQPNIIWIPTLENMLEDALFMIGLYVLKDKNLLSLANQYLKNPKKDYIQLYNDIKSENLLELYQQARLIESSHKLIISVFRGSTIQSQLSVLKQYHNDFEVCTSKFLKEFSLWTNRFETSGNL